MVPNTIELLGAPADSDGADCTFRRIVQRLGEAARSIEIHMYVWRSDAIGNLVARAGLAAADRGVRVEIVKDLGAFLYERVEMNRKPLFGSANFSVFSMQTAAEVDVLVRDCPRFLDAVRETPEQRLRESREVVDPAELAGCNRLMAFGQQIHQELDKLTRS